MSPQMEKSSVTEFLKLLVVLRVHAAHSFHHLSAQFHGRRERFRVAAQNVAEVDVEQFAALCEQQIVQMAITHSQQICDDAVAGCKNEENYDESERASE